MLPILFDEPGGAFLENSICTIFLGPLNFTCNSPGGNVTFTGLNGIDIFVDPSISNSTVFWNFTGSFGGGGNGTGNFTQIDETHTSLGGDANVFKNETAYNSNFRGITAGNLINVTERTNDILLDLGGNPNSNDLIFYNSTANQWETLDGCIIDGEILVYNGTTNQFECTTGQQFSASSSIDNDESFFPHLSASNGDDVIVTFTNYNTRAVKFRDNKDTTATWKYVVPQNYNATTLSFKLYWFTQNSNVGNVCWDLNVKNAAEGDDLDLTLTNTGTICTANLGIDILAVDTFSVLPATHGFTAGDMAFIQIQRDEPGTPADTFEKDVYGILGELRWVQ